VDKSLNTQLDQIEVILNDNSLLLRQGNFRSGIFYSYFKTLFLLLPLNYFVIAVTGWYYLNGDQIFWNAAINDISNYFWPLWYIIITFFVKTTVLEFNGLFINKEKNERIQQLFKNNEYYEKYRDRIFRKLSFKRQITFSLIAVIFFSLIFFVPVFEGQYYVWGINMLEYDISRAWIAAYIHIVFVIVIFFLSNAFYLLIIMLYSISLLGREKQGLSLMLFPTDPEKAVTKEELTEYRLSLTRFSSNVRVFGTLLFNTTLKILFLIVIWSFIAIYWRLSPIILFLSILLCFGIVLLSIAPQIIIHNFLSSTKRTTVNYFEQLIENLRIIIYHQIISPIGKEENASIDSNQVEQLKFLKHQIAEVREVVTWTYDFPAFLKLLIGSVTSITVIFVAIYIEFILKVLTGLDL
jgi:hypothetical protein